ncbi:uncharacterized protein [Nicotiana sylvestris]|uniref:uncharacterized protein n=1 Tax=Nicotiana sylvestris TaxID=4096 RepID=UPI00388C7C87
MVAMPGSVQQGEGSSASGSRLVPRGMRVLCRRRLLPSKAFNKLKSVLLHREATLRKAVDRKKSLRLLCDEREDELAHLRYEASRSLNYKSYPEEQLHKKTEDLERHWRDVGQAKCECDELMARVDAQVAAKKDALAKASTLEVQLRNARENSSVRTDMTTRHESELLKMKAEVTEARADAEAIQIKADKKVAIYLQDTTDARAELRRALNRESRSEEYVRCKSRRENLEEIHAKGFDISEEITQAKTDEYDAKFLLSDAENSEKEADGP